MAHPSRADAAHYRVRVASELNGRWALRLDGWQIVDSAAGATTIERHAADQAALYGLLVSLRDLGLVLLAVERLDTS